VHFGILVVPGEEIGLAVVLVDLVEQIEADLGEG